MIMKRYRLDPKNPPAVDPGRTAAAGRNQAFAAATASISISHSGMTSALTMIVAEPGAGVAEMLCARRAGCGHVFRPHQVSGDLHQIPDSHPGVREDGDNIPPAGLRLSLDPLRHSAVGEYTDLAGDVEEPGALGHFDRML